MLVSLARVYVIYPLGPTRPGCRGIGTMEPHMKEARYGFGMLVTAQWFEFAEYRVWRAILFLDFGCISRHLLFKAIDTIWIDDPSPLLILLKDHAFTFESLHLFRRVPE